MDVRLPLPPGGHDFIPDAGKAFVYYGRGAASLAPDGSRNTITLPESADPRHYVYPVADLDVFALQLGVADVLFATLICTLLAAHARVVYATWYRPPRPIRCSVHQPPMFEAVA